MKIDKALLCATVSIFVAAAFGVPLDCSTVTTETVLQAAAPKSEDLRDDSPRQPHWLSIPESRIVLNPYDFNGPTLPNETCTDLNLPLHVGYYAGGTAIRLDEVVTLYQKPLRFSAQSVNVFHEDNLAIGDGAWSSTPNVTLQKSRETLRVTAEGPMKGCPYCGYAERRVTGNLNRSPWLEVVVPSVDDTWALKVADPETSTEITLQRDSNTTGTFTYNISKATGWSGQKTFDIRFFAIGKGKVATLGALRLAGIMLAPSRREASACRTEWTPHQLKFFAQFPETLLLDDHGTSIPQPAGIEARDLLLDENTVLRRLQIPESASWWSLAGRYKGYANWGEDCRTLTIESTTYTAAIALSYNVRASNAVFYDSLLPLLAGDPGSSVPTSQNGYWAIDLTTDGQGHKSISVGISFAPAGDLGQAADAARAAVAADFDELSTARERWWDDYLARVPRPLQFDIRSVDPLGVSADDVRKAYYKAWAFLGANSLPVMPETNFHFRQVPAGKPSMWQDGHPRARATASWDSLFAMQLQAYTEPDLAWEAYEGLMTLVDETGRLGGESLPSRKAQTAWILHEVTPQPERLARVYPHLKRHLLWEHDNPRWIHKQHDFADEKDADFVVSLIIDMGHMARIAEALQNLEDVAFWRTKADKLFANYKRWFWKTPDATPVQIYFAGSERRALGNGLWVLSGLALPELQKSPELDGMWRLFDRIYRPDHTFGNFYLPKYPEMNFLVTGLLQRNRATEAAQIANICVRDVTRANMFAEQYGIGAFPDPDGVRPSAFGAALLIDMLWLKNGVRMDLGRPLPVKLPGECGGVANLQVRGQELTFVYPGD